jgi:hypothetical protein
MSYKEYIKNALQNYTTEYIIDVVDEINFNYNPKDNEILVVVKSLSGSVTGNVKFMPIQFNVFTSKNEVNKTKALLEQFVSDYSNTHTMIGLDYYKQDYTTPIDMNNFQQVGDGYRATLIITGTLMITNSIRDIKSVYINNKSINYTSVNFTYSTSPNASKPSGRRLQKTLIENANLLISLVCYCNFSPFDNMVSLLRQGELSLNTEYTLKFEYTDDSIEEYKCVIYSMNDNYDISNPPLRNVVFALC